MCALDDKQHSETLRHKWQRGFTILETTISVSLSLLILTNLFIFYYGSAKTSAKEQIKMSADRESRMVAMALIKQLRLVGLTAPEDMDGDSNDINRDKSNFFFSDSVYDDFEYANTYSIVFTGDVDGDDRTECVMAYLSGDKIYERLWEWSTDSLTWGNEELRSMGNNVDYLMFNFFDSRGDPIPNPVVYPEGGYTLTSGERARVTTVEIIVVLRTEDILEGERQYTYLPDGTYWYDNYKRIVQRFMVRGRNLSIGV